MSDIETNPLRVLDGGTVEFCASYLEFSAAHNCGPSSTSPVKTALNKAASDLRALLEIGKGKAT